MKLFLSKPRGFCAGVIRAIKTVEKALENFGPPIYVKHEIVHNKHVVDELKGKGAIFIEDLDQVPEGSRIIYSAHGVAPSVRDHAKKRRLLEIDASCGLVTRVHSAVKRYAKKGYHILLIGHKDHVEVIGTFGEAPDQTTIIETVDDVLNLNLPDTLPLFYTSQTTLSIQDVNEITSALKKKYPRVETLNSSSLCYATTNRQKALHEIGDLVDIVFVVGDPSSSNSNRLCEVARSNGIPSYLINCSSEISSKHLKNISNIGLTAGASTPEYIVQNCIDHLKKLGVTIVEEVEYTRENVHFALPTSVNITYS